MIFVRLDGPRNALPSPSLSKGVPSGRSRQRVPFRLGVVVGRPTEAPITVEGLGGRCTLDPLQRRRPETPPPHPLRRELSEREDEKETQGDTFLVNKCNFPLDCTRGSEFFSFFFYADSRGRSCRAKTIRVDDCRHVKAT